LSYSRRTELKNSTKQEYIFQAQNAQSRQQKV